MNDDKYIHHLIKTFFFLSIILPIYSYIHFTLFSLSSCHLVLSVHKLFPFEYILTCSSKTMHI